MDVDEEIDKCYDEKLYPYPWNVIDCLILLRKKVSSDLAGEVEEEIREYVDELVEDCLRQRGFARVFCRDLMIATVESRRSILLEIGVDVEGVLKRLRPGGL